jgi:hypothetical protein
MKNKHNRDAYAFADDYEVEDGQSVRVPVMVCDGLSGHRPGYPNVNWREIAERRRVARLCSTLRRIRLSVMARRSRSSASSHQIHRCHRGSLTCRC